MRRVVFGVVVELVGVEGVKDFGRAEYSKVLCACIHQDVVGVGFVHLQIGAVYGEKGCRAFGLVHHWLHKVRIVYGRERIYRFRRYRVCAGQQNPALALRFFVLVLCLGKKSFSVIFSLYAKALKNRTYVLYFLV